MPSGKKSVIISTLGNIAPPIVGIVTAPILAASLGPVARGELAAATTILILSVSISALGLPQALIYFTARKGTNYRKFVLKVFAFLGLLGILASAVIIFFSNFLSAGDNQLARLISFASFAISPALLLASVRGIASGIQAWGLITWEKVVSNGIRFASILVAFYAGFLTLEVATLIVAITNFIGLATYISLPKRVRHYKSNANVTPQTSDLLSFATQSWLGILAGALLARVDQIILLPLSGAAQLGNYAVAVSIAEMCLMFNYAVNTVMNSREASGPDINQLAMAARISSFVTFTGCIIIALFAHFVVPILFGEEFSLVIPVVWILLIGIALSNSGSVVGAGFNGRGRPGIRSLSMTFALIVNVMLLFLLAPSYGAIGAAIATTISTILYSLTNIALFGRIYDVKMSTFTGIRKSDLAFLLSSTKRPLRT